MKKRRPDLIVCGYSSSLPVLICGQTIWRRDDFIHFAVARWRRDDMATGQWRHDDLFLFAGIG